MWLVGVLMDIPCAAAWLPRMRKVRVQFPAVAAPISTVQVAFRGVCAVKGGINGQPIASTVRDRKRTRLNSSHSAKSRMPSSA